MNKQEKQTKFADNVYHACLAIQRILSRDQPTYDEIRQIKNLTYHIGKQAIYANAQYTPKNITYDLDKPQG